MYEAEGMHPEARHFTEFVRDYLPDFCSNKKVLDVGSGDINGNNRFLFTECEYDGNDVIAAPNVTVVSKTADLAFPDSTFDTIVSTECLEHDPAYEASLRKVVAMLKPGGLFFFTCASTGRAEHGTLRTSPGCSYATLGGLEGWTDYYKNLTIADVDAAIPLESIFSQYRAYYNAQSNDLYFWGVKAGGALVSIPDYNADGVNRAE
jgi:SAM-dependent methyltransferase